MSVRKDGITKQDVGKTFKMFVDNVQANIIKVREIHGVGFEQRFEYHRWNHNKQHWERVHETIYCECEGHEYEPVGRLEWVILFGETCDGRFKKEDLAH